MTSNKFDTLLICASFFGYATKIREELERRGRRVVWVEDRPGTDSLTKALIRVAPSFIKAKADAYFKNVAAGIADSPIRDVLVIKGEALSPDAVRLMKSAFPKARFTLYFWDSYNNMPSDSREKAEQFDRVLTFDPVDAQADRRMTYRPLFFTEEFTRAPQVEQDIDLLFSARYMATDMLF
jgi:hypothetical protein